MKRLFTLVAGLMLSTFVFANHKPATVKVMSSNHHQVFIDGQAVKGKPITLANGTHQVQVYEVLRDGKDRQTRLLSQTGFQMNGNDIMIRVNRDGQVLINEKKAKNHDANDDGINDDDANGTKNKDARQAKAKKAKKANAGREISQEKRNERSYEKGMGSKGQAMKGAGRQKKNRG